MTNTFPLHQLIASHSVLIDLRSEAEFARGHIPRAVNIPVLNDTDRHEVGLTYKVQGQSAAIDVGLTKFSKKSRAFLQRMDHAAEGQDRQLLLHCWRGGMRSRFTKAFLDGHGFRPVVLEGGYKAYRHEVLGLLDRLCQHPLLVLHGKTGVGKTALLEHFTQDFPVIDLEHLAAHRGSAFGDFHLLVAQPTQQDFENTLTASYFALGDASVILIEIERILGQVKIPAQLRKHIISSPMVLIEREFSDRVQRLSSEYTKLWNETVQEQFEARLALLQKYLTKDQLHDIAESVRLGHYTSAIEILLRSRYDKAYEKSIEAKADRIIATFNMTNEESPAVQYISQYLAMPPNTQPQRSSGI